MAPRKVYKQMFLEIDQESDGEVSLGEVVPFLRAMNEDIDNNLKVKFLLDQFDSSGENILTFSMFCNIMQDLEAAGWKKAPIKKTEDITNSDIKSVFNLVDVDKSGCVSRKEAKMACKLLNKRFGIENVTSWIKETDENDDGELSYEEFESAILKAIESNKKAGNEEKDEFEG